MTSQPERLASLMTVLQQRWGVRALRRLQIGAGREGLTTGVPALDRLLGGAGVPYGALTCLAGSLTSGKTTLALDMLAHAQAHGEVTAIFDLAGAVDPEYAEQRGVDLGRLLIVRPHPALLGLDMVRDLVRSAVGGLLLLDTGDGLDEAGLLRDPLHKLQQMSAAVRRSGWAVLCLTPSPPDRLGAALLRLAEVCLQVTRQRWLGDESGIQGYEVCVTVLKNRRGAAGGRVTIPVILGERRPRP